MTFNEAVPRVIEGAGWLAPILFIAIHLVRPFLFIPVIVVCIAGGYIFGFVQGTIYSIIGLTLVSFYFYQIINIFPRFRLRLVKWKKKIFKDRVLTVGQLMILRMIPFVHFHLLSFYLMEMTDSFKQYMKYSIGGVILPSIFYTAYGQAITQMPMYVSITLLVGLTSLFSYLGKRAVVIYKWDNFFSSKSTID